MSRAKSMGALESLVVDIDGREGPPATLICSSEFGLDLSLTRIKWLYVHGRIGLTTLEHWTATTLQHFAPA